MHLCPVQHVCRMRADQQTDRSELTQAFPNLALPGRRRALLERIDLTGVAQRTDRARRGFDCALAAHRLFGA